MRITRRAFCQSGSAAVAGTLLPGFPALGQATKVGRSVPSAIRAVKLDGSATSIEAAALRELSAKLQRPRSELLADAIRAYARRFKEP